MALAARNSVNLGRKAAARASRQAVVVKAAVNPRDLLSKGAAIATAGLLMVAPAFADSPSGGNVPNASPASGIGPNFQVENLDNKQGVRFSGLPADGVVNSPIHVDFLVNGLKVLPASEGKVPGTGHFHVIIDRDPAPEGEVVPFDPNHLHFGKGQTSADIELSSGTHKLTLQFADAEHRSYGPAFADQIVVEVIDPPLVKQQKVRDPPTLEQQNRVSPDKKLQL